MSMAATISADETQISAMTVAGRAGPKKMSGLRSRNLVARGPSTVWRRSSRLLPPTRRTLARNWRALPLSVRAVLLMVTGSLLFSGHGRARQAFGAANRQLSDRLLPLLLWVYRDPAFHPSQAGSSRLPHDPFLRPFPTRRARRCGDRRRLLRDDPAAADRLDGDQLFRPAVHDPHRHLPARRKGALAAGARHRYRLYRRIGNGPAR